jgi:uncharacterized Zn-binding protein involved in type VI secretion
MGAVAGVALALAIVAIVGTGGVAAVAIGAGIAAAGAGGALAGAHIGEIIPSEPKGPIATGSRDTLIGSGRRGVARAGLDFVACTSDGVKLLAQGSSTVYVNQRMVARKSEKAVCSGIIREGCPTVLVGGETATVPGLAIEDEIPPWVKTTLTAVMIGGAILATAGAALVVGVLPAVLGLAGGLAGGTVGGYVGGLIGRAVGGELGARIGEVVGGTIGSLGGGILGARVGARLQGAGAPVVMEEPPALQRGYPKPSAQSNAAVDNVFNAMEQAGVGKNRAVGAVVDQDGTVTVAVSGQPAKVQGVYDRINPYLPPEYQYAGPVDLNLDPVVIDGEAFPGGSTCAEVKLSPALQREPEGMTVRWRGDSAKNHYPVESGSADMKPCPSCAYNEGRIVNGPPTPEAPDALPPPGAPLAPPLLSPRLSGDRQDDQ